MSTVAESSLTFLQSWYLAHSNGFWEHGNGITIESLAAPGWVVTIDLSDTPFDGREMNEYAVRRSPKDWIVCKVRHSRFQGEGDPKKLTAILQVFQRWVLESGTVK